MNTPPSFSTLPQSEPSDYDNLWQGALEVFFQPFLELLFPQVACRVDWQVASNLTCEPSAFCSLTALRRCLLRNSSGVIDGLTAGTHPQMCQYL